MFEGKSAFVTGGGTGIGLACAKAIVDAGGVVTIAGRRTEVLEAAAEQLGANASWVHCDITSAASVSDAVAKTVADHGSLHLAVNSAYQAMVGSFLGTPSDLFAMTTDATLNGTYRAMQAEGTAMRAAGGGSIVNISSVASSRRDR